MENHGPWKTIKTTTPFESPWIKINHSEVLNPAGNPGTYSVVHFKSIAIGIIVLDEDFNTWIVGQYRYPMKSYEWEIPEGGGALDVPPLDSAKRELLEECGIKASKWTKIQEMQLSNSASDETSITYLAQGLSFHEQQLEETEDITVKKLPFTEFYRMVIEGEIRDSITVCAALRLKIMIDEGEVKK